MPDPAAAHRESLLNLAQALALLAAHAQTHSNAARDIARLAARAEAIAMQAHALSATRFPDKGAAAALAREFDTFLADANAVASRAARDAGASREVARAMARHAEDLALTAGDLAGVDDLAVIRRRLRPLAAALLELPARLQAQTATATDVAALGPRAQDLADRSKGLHENARTPGVAAVAIYKDLRDFAEAAGTIADAMFAEASRARATVAGMTDRIARLGTPEPATPPTTATARLTHVVARHAAPAGAVSWKTGQPS